MTREQAEAALAGVKWYKTSDGFEVAEKPDVLRALEALPSVEEIDKLVRVSVQEWKDRCIKAEAEIANADEALCDKQREMLKWIARAEKAEAQVSVLGGEWCAENRAKGEDGCGACAWCCKQATDRAEKAEAELAILQMHDCERWREEGMGCAVCNKKRDELKAELALAKEDSRLLGDAYRKFAESVPAGKRAAFVAGVNNADDVPPGEEQAEALLLYPDPAGEDDYQQHTDMPKSFPAQVVSRETLDAALAEPSPMMRGGIADAVCKPVETDGHGFQVPHQETTLTTTFVEECKHEWEPTWSDGSRNCGKCGKIERPAEDDDIVRMFDGNWTREQYDDLRTLAGRIKEPLERRLERDADILQIQRGMFNNLDGAVSEIKARVAKLEAVGTDILAQNVTNAVDRIYALEAKVEKLEEGSDGK